MMIHPQCWPRAPTLPTPPHLVRLHHCVLYYVRQAYIILNL